jgi:hypothetical protein
LVGVQSNQFPRAVDLAKPFLRAGLPVCIGGFHVSGSIAMLPEIPGRCARRQRSVFPFCRRGGARPTRSGDPRRLGWLTSTNLKLYERFAVIGGGAATDPAA